jgi:hypothetical protein
MRELLDVVHQAIELPLQEFLAFEYVYARRR